MVACVEAFAARETERRMSARAGVTTVLRVRGTDGAGCAPDRPSNGRAEPLPAGNSGAIEIESGNPKWAPCQRARDVTTAQNLVQSQHCYRNVVTPILLSSRSDEGLVESGARRLWDSRRKRGCCGGSVLTGASGVE